MSIHLKPILTEKALSLASANRYSFWVPTTMSKDQIKTHIKRIYAVDVREIKTSNHKAVSRRTLRRGTVTSRAQKKTIVTLKAGQKIDAFTEVEKGKSN